MASPGVLPFGGGASSQGPCRNSHPARRRNGETHLEDFKIDLRERSGEKPLRRGVDLPNSPNPGVIVAFIEHDGAPIELLQIDRAVAKEGI